MKNLFKYRDHLSYISETIDERKIFGLTRAQVAKWMGCQAAYLSQALKGKVAFTEEHLHRFASHMEMSELETDYLLTLLRISRAGNPGLQSFLKKRLGKIKDEGSELVSRLHGVESFEGEQARSAYYTSSWIPALLHLSTSCEALRSPLAMGQRWGLEKETVLDHLVKLEKYGFVERQKDVWVYKGGSLHFPKNSPFDLQMQIARRLFALSKIQFVKKSDLHYSVVFASDAKTVELVRQRMIDFIEIIHKEIEPSPCEDVYSICIDLF